MNNNLMFTVDVDAAVEKKAPFLDAELTRVIREAITQKGWSKQTLSEKAGIAQSTISILMAGEGAGKGRSWTLKQLIRVSFVLGVSLADLIAAAESGNELPELMIDLAGTEPHSKERLTRIIQTIAAKGVSKEVLDLYFTADMLQISAPKYVEEYYEGAVSDREVYDLLVRVNAALSPEENLWVKLAAALTEKKA